MNKLKFYIILIFISVHFFAEAQVAFTPGNFVVCRIGDGVNALNYNAPVLVYPAFLDEFTPAGVLVQSVAMPVSANGDNKALTLAPARSYGLINLSTDGQSLVLAGLNAPPGKNVLNSPIAVSRTIGLIKYDGTINTTTSVNDLAGYPSSAVSNGIDIWCTSNAPLATFAGIRYTTLGAASSTQISTTAGFSDLKIVNGQLYASTDQGEPWLGTVGTGTPTSSGQNYQSPIGFPELGGAQGSFFQFAFADLNTDIQGIDVLYVASGAGLQKFSFDGTSWINNGAIGTYEDQYRGITASIAGNTATLYATRAGSQSGVFGPGGELVTLKDASGWNGAFAGTPTVLSSIASRFGANDVAAYRGVSLVPKAPSANQTISFENITKVYGDADFSPATASSGLPVSYTSSNPAVATVVDGKLHITGSGTAQITANQEGSITVNPAPPITKTLTVNKAPLTITAENKSKVQAEVVPVLTVTYAGFVNNETSNILIAQPSITTTATINSPVGTYPIMVSGAVAANYTITHVNGTLTVTALPVSNSKVVAYFPSSSTLKITIYAATAQKATIQLADVSGKILIAKDIDLQQGLNTYNLSAGNLGRGGYIVRILGDNLKLNHNIIKANN